MKKPIALLLVLALLLSISACASNAPAKGALTITDMTGREINLDKPAEKIVAITAADCEILYALGAGNTVVGRGEYCDYPAEVESVPSVQSGSDTNIEQIVALKPDVVIMSTMAQTEEQIASLENAGIQVVVSEAKTINDVYTAITLIGTVAGKNDEAKTIIGTMKKAFEDIKARVQSDGTKTVYFEISPLEYGLWASGTGTFMDEIGIMLGLSNIFADFESWAQVSEEQVIQRNPDYIITTTMSFEGSQDPVDEVMGRQGWGDTTAIKNGSVYNADSDAITRPGPRLADAAKELYDFVYGG